MKRRNGSILVLLAAILAAGFIYQLAAREGVRLFNIRTNTTEVPKLPFIPATDSDVAGKAVAAARAFVATLNDNEKKKTLYAIDSPQKTRWSNLPSGIFKREGFRLGDMSSAQRKAAMALVATALSKQGMQKVMEIMEGDEVLKNSGVGPDGGPISSFPGNTGARPPQGAAPPARLPGGLVFSRDEYYLAILGTPSLTEPWIIQYGGHHLAINVTIAGKNSVLTPSLPAAQPAVYKLNGETVRPLGRENDKGFALINSLSDSQQKKAKLNYEIAELVLGAGQDGKTIQPEGIKASELNEKQKEMLLDLAHEWVGILNDDAAKAKMAEVKGNIDSTWFAWSGPTTNGKGAYFRIQGPTIFIEYSPQHLRGGGLDPNHLHTIYRDPTNEYGARFVKR